MFTDLVFCKFVLKGLWYNLFHFTFTQSLHNKSWWDFILVQHYREQKRYTVQCLSVRWLVSPSLLSKVKCIGVYLMHFNWVSIHSLSQKMKPISKNRSSLHKSHVSTVTGWFRFGIEISGPMRKNSKCWNPPILCQASLNYFGNKPLYHSSNTAALSVKLAFQLWCSTHPTNLAVGLAIINMQCLFRLSK